ncbi:UNVERIFIED_CONTAM: hypothetical protein FKN15_047610 [Acipenser sinensis]
MRDGEYMNTGDKNFTQSLTNTDEQYCGVDMDVLHVPELQQEEHRLDHTRTAEWRHTVEGPAERNALPHAEEGSKAESVPIQEELFDQEWCRSPEQATELTSIEGEEETPALDPVHFKEEASELEPVHVNEEIPGIEPVIIKEEVLELESHPIEDGGSEYFERRQQIHAGQNVHLCTTISDSSVKITADCDFSSIDSLPQSIRKAAVFVLMEEARVRPVCEMKEEMDICASSASLLEEELASAIEPAVKAAVLSVMSALAKFVDSKCAVFNLRLDERDQEFESVRLRLEIAESELKAVSEREYMNTGDKNFTQSLTNTDTQYHGSDSIIAHGLPARDFSTVPVQAVRDPVSAVHTALKRSRVLIQEDGSYSEQDLLMRGDDSEQRDHTSTAGWRRALKVFPEKERGIDVGNVSSTRCGKACV